MQQRLTRFTAPYAFVLLAGVMLVAETPVCRAGDAAPADVRLQKFDFGDRVRAVVDRHMLPRIEAVNSASEALSKSIMRACKAQDAKSWSDARQDFAKTISAWAALSHLRFGPFAKDERARRVSFWPDPRSVVWRQMRKVRRDKNGELLLPGALAHKSVAIQGLTALEWLIPKGDKIESKPPYPGDYDCSFAVAIASNVSSIVKSIRDDLTGAHSWRQKWTSQARDPSGIRLDQIAMTDLVRSALLGLQLIREHQVVVIQSLVAGEGRASRLPYYRSGNAALYLTASIDGVCELLDLLKLGDMAPQDQPWMKAWIANACKNLKQRSKAIRISVNKEDIAQHIDVFDLRQLRFYTNGLRQIIGRHIVPSAGLTIGFNELDGD